MSSIVRVSDEMKKLINDFHNKLISYGLRITKTKSTAILARVAKDNLIETNGGVVNVKIIKPSGYRELKSKIKQ